MKLLAPERPLSLTARWHRGQRGQRGQVLQAAAVPQRALREQVPVQIELRALREQVLPQALYLPPEHRRPNYKRPRW